MLRLSTNPDLKRGLQRGVSGTRRQPGTTNQSPSQKYLNYISGTRTGIHQRA